MRIVKQYKNVDVDKTCANLDKVIKDYEDMILSHQDEYVRIKQESLFYKFLKLIDWNPEECDIRADMDHDIWHPLMEDISNYRYYLRELKDVRSKLRSLKDDDVIVFDERSSEYDHLIEFK